MADSSPASLQIARRIQQLSEITGKAVSWLTLLMMLLMTLVVVLRYGFGMGWIALQESVLYLHAMVLMLGMAYTMKHDGHVRVDIFFRRFPPKKKNWVNLGGHLLLLLISLTQLFDSSRQSLPKARTARQHSSFQ